MTRSARLLLLTLFPLVALLLAGCGATIADSPGGVAGQSTSTIAISTGVAVSYADSGAPPVILRNPAPGTLDVSMSVTFDQGIGDTQLMAEVDLGLQSGDKSVQLTGDERLTCDGTALQVHDRIAVFQVIRAPAAQLAGTTIHCAYTAANITASVVLAIPQPPAITSPRNGASVPRRSATVVAYRYDPATTSTLLGVVALAPDSAMPKAIARMNTPGPAQATVDTSRFSPGPGSIVLTATLAPHITGAGAPFKSLSAFGSATALVNVTWT